MTDAELQTVREKLNPYFVPYSQKPKNYKVTNSKKVQPDMWVKDVSKSIVLQVSGISGQRRFLLRHISCHKVILSCIRGETVPSVTVTVRHSNTQWTQ